jgi:hypothetical protein
MKLSVYCALMAANKSFEALNLKGTLRASTRWSRIVLDANIGRAISSRTTPAAVESFHLFEDFAH